MDFNNPHDAARDLLRRGDVVKAFDLLSVLGFIRDGNIPIVNQVVAHSVHNFGLKAPYETIFPTTIVCAASWCGFVTDAVRAELKLNSLTTRLETPSPWTESTTFASPTKRSRAHAPTSQVW